MGFHIISSVLLICCIVGVFASAIPDDNDYRQLPPKRNFVKDLEANEKDEMSKFALHTLNSLDPTYSKRILCSILEGKKQFASGIVYKLKLSVVIIPEEELEPSANSQALCNEREDKVVCEIDVLRSYAATDYSPINAQVVKSECGGIEESSVQKREAKSHSVVGGKEAKDPNSEDIQKLAKTVLAKLDAESGSSCTRRINKVLGASTQVVAGLSTELRMEVCQNSCANNAATATEADDCRICTVKVWEKPWMSFMQVSDFKCDDSDLTQQNSLEADRSMFHEFIQKYNKSYDSKEERERRFHIFRGNLKKIQLLNLREEGTAEYGINEFADLSKSEFKNYYLGLKPSESRIEKQAIIPNVRLPQEFDWRNYNAVTPVKNQGMCGSCWAFSVTGNVEGQWAVKHHNLVSLSEQELIDCDKYDNGCMGGYMTDAYKAIEDLGGLEKENDYPYEGSNDKCVFSKSKAVVEVVDSVNITSNESEMAQWLFKNGPISVALNAFAMQFYIRGVSKPWKFLCNPNDLDHGVLIVGFGVFKQKLPYWIIKNSWGSHWGESGYYRLYRGSGACGVNKMASSAIVS